MKIQTRRFALTGPATILALAVTARANTITGNTLANTSTSGACSLRDAVTSASTATAFNGCSAGSGTGDAINFSVSCTITLSGSSELTSRICQSIQK